MQRVVVDGSTVRDRLYGHSEVILLHNANRRRRSGVTCRAESVIRNELIKIMIVHTSVQDVRPQVCRLTHGHVFSEATVTVDMTDMFRHVYLQ